MTTNKHTSGPWTGKGPDGQWFQDHDWRADNDAARRTQFAPIHANGKVIALVVREDWNDAQLEADAALMAAAPEMYEALEAIEGAVNDLHVKDLITTDEHGMILAALAKARGEAA